MQRHENWQRGELGSGLRFLLVPNQAFHSVVLTAHVTCGSRFEEKGRFGLSHFLEHMLFYDVAPYREPAELSRGLAGLGGEANAITTHEVSSFVVTVHKDYWKRGLQLLANLLLDAGFTAEQVDCERAVIVQELARSRGLGAMSNSVQDLAYNLVWRPANLHVTVVGDKETILATNREALGEHHRQFFTPDNVVICVAGGFDSAEASDSISEVFEGFLGNADFTTPGAKQDQSSAAWVIVRQPWPVVSVTASWRAVSYLDPKHYALLVIADMLGGGAHSRLFTRLREQKGLTYDISSQPSLYRDFGSLDVNTNTRPENLEELLRELFAIACSLTREGFTTEEFEQTRSLVRCHTDFLLDSPYELAEWFGKLELIERPGRIIPPEEKRDRILAVTLDEVNALAEEVLRPDKLNVALVGRLPRFRSSRIKSLIRTMGL